MFYYMFYYIYYGYIICMFVYKLYEYRKLIQTTYIVGGYVYNGIKDTYHVVTLDDLK